MEPKVENNVEEDIINSRKKALSNKFKIDSELISENDISCLIQKLKISDISTNDYVEILNELDFNQNKKAIKVEEFLKKIQSNKSSNKHINSLYQKLNDQLCTKAERIIMKLKSLRNKCIFNNDEESQKEFDCIIKMLDDGDIYEPSVEQINQENSEIGEFNFLKEYSHYNKKYEREQDIKKVNSYKKSHRKNVILRAPSFMIKRKGSKINNDKEAEETSKSALELTREIVITLGENLENVRNFTFDIFKVYEICGEKTLYYISYQILSHYEFFDYLIDEDVYKKFAEEINKNYSKGNSYHNEIHGVDVMQTLFVFFYKGNLNEKINLNDIDILSSLIAAMCHDYKHSGFSNNFEISFKTPIALTYNDCSVLENHHISETFKTLLKSENNITEKFNDEQYRLFRRRVIDCILATDMVNHVKHISSLRSKIETFAISKGNNIDKIITNQNASKDYENQQLILGTTIHCCDISNPAKVANVYDKWVDLIFIEFFNQGDMEKKANMPVSLLCDRDTTNIFKAQIGFINFIVKPTFESIINFFPDISPYLDAIDENLIRYENKNSLNNKVETSN